MIHLALVILRLLVLAFAAILFALLCTHFIHEDEEENEEDFKS
jgi:hypothetical protein